MAVLVPDDQLDLLRAAPEPNPTPAPRPQLGQSFDQPDAMPAAAGWQPQTGMNAPAPQPFDYFNGQQVTSAPTGAWGDNAPAAGGFETLGRIGSGIAGFLGGDVPEALRPDSGATFPQQMAGSREVIEGAIMNANLPRGVRSTYGMAGDLNGAIAPARLPQSEFGRTAASDALFTLGPNGERVGPTGNVSEMRLGREPARFEDQNRGLRSTPYGRAEQANLAAEEQAAFQGASDRAIAGANPIGGGSGATAAGGRFSNLTNDELAVAIGRAKGSELRELNAEYNSRFTALKMTPGVGYIPASSMTDESVQLALDNAVANHVTPERIAELKAEAASRGMTATGGSGASDAEFARLTARADAEKAATGAVSAETHDSLMNLLGERIGATPAAEQGAAREAFYRDPANLGGGAPPPPERGYTRLYRVEPTELPSPRSGTDEASWRRALGEDLYAKTQAERGRLFSDDPTQLTNYGHGEPGNATYYVDVPNDVAASAKRTGLMGNDPNQPFNEFLLPREVADAKQPLRSGLTPEQQANVSGTVQRAGQLNTITDSLANAREQAPLTRAEQMAQAREEFARNNGSPQPATNEYTLRDATRDYESAQEDVVMFSQARDIYENGDWSTREGTAAANKALRDLGVDPERWDEESIREPLRDARIDVKAALSEVRRLSGTARPNELEITGRQAPQRQTNPMGYDRPVGGGAVPPSGNVPMAPSGQPARTGPVVRGDAGIVEALARKEEALHRPDNPLLGPEGSRRRAILAPIYNPSANMPREVHVANNARVAVQSSLYGEFNRAEQTAARTVQSAFDANKPTYIGAVKNKVTGTAADYLERPSQYTNVSPELDAAKQTWADAQSASRDTARSRYNVEVGDYTQADPNGVYVPHVQSADTMDQAVQSVSSSLAGRSGVAKTRGYDTLFDRVQNRPDFTPETDLQLLADRHAQSLASLASRETFKQGVGGLDRMQVLEETHPKLAAQVKSLRAELQWGQGTKARLGNQISAALDDFMASPKEAADAATLQGEMATYRDQITDPQIRTYLDKVRADLRAIQPALKSADTGDYVMSRDTFKYMPKASADAASSVLKQGFNNAFVDGAISVADEARGLQLGPDFSPLSIQGMVGAMSHPEVPIQHGAGLAKVAFSQGALRDLVDPALVQRYEFATGRSFGDAGAEFRQEGRGLERPFRIPASVPGVGGVPLNPLHTAIGKFNAGLERMVEYGTLRAWENDSNLLQKFGVPQNVADHEAANSISKFVPRLSQAEVGKSAQRAKLERLPLISTSFRLAPIALAKDVATAAGKLAVHAGNPAEAWGSLTGREQLALLRGATFASTWAAMSVGSAIVSAEQNNEDVAEKVKSVLDPNSGRFGNILIGKTGGFGIGGPMRTTIRGLWPVAITAKAGVEVLPHFWNYARGSSSNVLSTPIALIRDKDYSGKPIYTAKTQIARIGQGIEYGLEQLNMIAGAAMQDIRQGTPQDIPSDVMSQLAGVNYYDTKPTPKGGGGVAGPDRPSRPSRPERPSR